MRRVVAHPLVHFVVLGAVLSAGARWWRRPIAARRTVTVPAARIAALRDDWTATAGRAPQPPEEAALARSAADDEILIDAARAIGLDRTPSVRARLAQLMQLTATDPGEDPGALERAARALALDRSDVVVRRHLGVLMRLALARVPDAERPDDAALQAFLDAHADAFRAPERWRLAQVFATTRADASALMTSLDGVAVDAPAARAAGAPFIHGRELEGSAAELDKRLGGGFAAQLAGAPSGRWLGPLRSPYGWHLVWIRAHDAARVPPLDVVRGRVLQAWLRDRGAAESAARMAALRARYDVAAAP